jgi:predicted PurR-regulated permease PerM
LLENKKIPYFKFIPVLLIAFILYRLVNNIEYLPVIFKFLMSILSFVVWAFCIAYLLNPIMSFLERRFKLKRLYSMLIVYILYIGLITFFIIVLVPVVVKNIWDLIESIPGYISITREWVENLLDSNAGWLSEYGIDIFVLKNTNFITNNMNSIATFLSDSFVSIIDNAIIVTTGVLKFILGSAISVYFLKDKDILVLGVKKAVFASFNRKTADTLAKIANRINHMFSRFLIGKTIDSLIMGVLCFIGLKIIGVPYALLISLIVAITNMIPYFGPIIGAVPAVILTLFYSPVKAFWVLVFILILQQFDGFVLGPKILGDSVGIRPLWIIVGVLAGGGLFGPVGMILGVPLIASIRLFVNEFVEKKLQEKNIRLE